MNASHPPLGFCPHCDYPLVPGTCPECGRSVAQPSRTRLARRRTIIKRFFAFAFAIAACIAGVYWAGPRLLARTLPTSALEAVIATTDTRSSFGRRVDKWAFNALFNRAHNLRTAVAAEYARLPGHRWAGHYETWFTLDAGGQYHLAPGSGFVWFSHSGWSRVLPKFGTVEVIDEFRIRLNAIGKRDDRISGDYVVVSWGGKRNLIREEQMTLAVAQFNACSYFGHEYTDSKGPLGLEESLRVPAPYDALVLREPLEAEITDVEIGAPVQGPEWAGYLPGDLVCPITVTLDRGSDHGIVVGHRFFTAAETDYGCVKLDVIECMPEWSRCRTNLGLGLTEIATLETQCRIHVGAQVATCTYERDGWGCCGSAHEE